MARQVFFSFHYNIDLWRANVVRNSDVVKAAETEVGRYDHSLWEEAKAQGDAAIQKLIDDGLKGASVTVVLIGASTYERKWCLYELAKSHVDGKGLLGVRINAIKDQGQKTGDKGPDPFDYANVTAADGKQRTLAGLYPVYDWVADRGYEKIDTWIETAAKAAGR
jgi:MTH538 TIR-like domain (DUF1863)